MRWVECKEDWRMVWGGGVVGWKRGCNSMKRGSGRECG